MKLTIIPFWLVSTSTISTAATRTTSATTTTIRGSSSAAAAAANDSDNDNDNTDASSKNAHRKLAWDLGAWAGDVWDELTDGFGDEGEPSSLSPSNNNGVSTLPPSNNNDDDNNNNNNDMDMDWDWDEWLSALLNGNTVDGLVDGVPDNSDGLLDGVFGDGVFDPNFLLGDGLSVCSLIEFGIGMTPIFGIEANCDCSKGDGKGLRVGCSFEQCAARAPGDGDNDNDNGNPDADNTCGTVDLDFEFGATGGVVNAGACVDFAGDRYRETCFSYAIDVRSGTPTTMATTNTTSTTTTTTTTETATATTCKASYDGKSCECSMDSIFCLSIDCSAHLPGGKMDTCQTMSMVGLDDIPNWFPNFDAFVPGFELPGNDNDDNSDNTSDNNNDSNSDSDSDNNSDQDVLQDQIPEQDAADPEESLPVNINPIVQPAAPGEDLPVDINLVLPNDQSVIAKSEMGDYTSSSSSTIRGSCSAVGLLVWAAATAAAALVVGLY